MATILTLVPPSTIAQGYLTDNFTVLLSGDLPGSAFTVTPAASVAGTFVPTTVNLGPTTLSATFQFLPTTSALPTFSVTNSGGYANPASISYAASGSISVGTGTIQFTSPVFAGAANTTGYVYVSRTDGSTGAASVMVQTSNGSAVAGTDYSSVSTTLNWADTESGPKPVAVPLLLDSMAGDTRTVTLTISNATGATVGIQNTATLNIIEGGGSGSGNYFNTVIAGKTLLEWETLRISKEFGNSTGEGTPTVRYFSPDGSKPRVTQVVDNKGNVVASVLDAA